MQINVELDGELIDAIDLAVDIQGMSRDAAFKEALESWVKHQPKSKGFSIDPRTVEFDPDLVFELDRPGPEAFSVSCQQDC